MVFFSFFFLFFLRRADKVSVPTWLVKRFEAFGDGSAPRTLAVLSRQPATRKKKKETPKRKKKALTLGILPIPRHERHRTPTYLRHTPPTNKKVLCRNQRLNNGCITLVSYIRRKKEKKKIGLKVCTPTKRRSSPAMCCVPPSMIPSRQTHILPTLGRPSRPMSLP